MPRNDSIQDISAPLSEAELNRIEAEVLSATPGPWESFVEGRDHTSGSSFIRTNGGHGPDIEVCGGTVADQELIAHAHEVLPRLIAEIRHHRSSRPKK